MGIFDNLFGRRKGPGRGRAARDDDESASYTRAIRRDDLERQAPPADDWDPPAPPRSAPAAEDFEARAPAAPPAPAPPRRVAPPPPPPAPVAPRAHTPPTADDDEVQPTEYAKVSRAPAQKVAGLLLGVQGPLEGHVIRIYQGENILGREAEPEPNDSVPAAIASISRKHAKLTADGGYFVLEPVQLKNATLVADAPIDSHAVLQHGDRITLGTTKPCTFVLLAVPA
jgi:hypothetical protein